jgi:hypothetical protein
MPPHITIAQPNPVPEYIFIGYRVKPFKKLMTLLSDPPFGSSTDVRQYDKSVAGILHAV